MPAPANSTDTRVTAVALAIAQLRSLRDELTERQYADTTASDEVHEIELQRPILDQSIIDMGRLYDALVDTTLPMAPPAAAVMTELTAATTTLANAIATQGQTSALLAAATTLVTAANQLRAT